MFKCLLLILISFFTSTVFAQRIKTPSAKKDNFVRFTENKNQWDNHISYRAQLDGGALFIEKSGKLTYHLYDKDSYRNRHLGKITSDKLKHHAYTIDFIGANNLPVISAKNKYYDYVNYFVGSNKDKWTKQVSHYQSILVSNLYNGVDALFDGGNQSIKYNFIVHPHTDVNLIKLQYNGVENIKLKNGALYVSTSVSESIEQKPFVYQIIEGDTIEIASKFVLEKNTVSFKLLQAYNHDVDLIIDPLLVFAASSGSTADNFGMTATYDSRGSLYTGGTCFNVGYPTTIGAYDVSFNGTAGSTDVVITKYDSAGVFLKYSTYFGGATGSEIVTSLIVDKNDHLCLYGATGSSDLPTTTGCFDNSFGGGQYLNYPQNGTLFNNGTDIYVAKINSAGNTLMASTYLGGSQNDGVNNNINTALYDSLMFNYGDQFRGEIQVDSLDEVYVMSSTKSIDFPIVGGFDNSLGGNQDAVLIKLNANFSSIVYSTFIGGNNSDAGYALCLDDTLNVYVTGGTRSNDFPITTGSYKTNYQGGVADGYVCKIKKDGSYIMHSSYIGTGSYDQSYFVQLDNQQNVYLYGQSLGSMPVTSGVYSNTNSKQFIQKLNSQLNTLLASTVFGNGNGQSNISPSAFSIDCAGNVYLSGWGGNILTGIPTTNMPLTSNAIQSTTDGFNFYMMVLAPNMSALKFGSYFGGASSAEHVDGGTSRFDKRGIIYQSVCAGCGGNDDFPVSPGAWPTSLYGSNVNQNSNCNNGVFKIDFELNTAQANISANTVSGCAPLVVNFTNSSTLGHSYLWNFGGNDTTSQILNPIKTFTASGTYTVQLYVKKSICNNLYDTAKITITVHPKPVANFTLTLDSCSNNVHFINQSLPASTSPKWYLNNSVLSTNNNPSYSFLSAGTYSVKLVSTTNFGCKDSIAKNIIVPVDSTNVNAPISKCSYSTVSLLAQGGVSYTWSPNTGLSNSNVANPICNVTTTTVYTVSILQNSLFGKACVKTLTTLVTVYPKITADFTYTIGACHNNVQFTDASTLTPVSWQWNFGDANTNNTQNPLHFYTAIGQYTASLIVENAFGCKDTTEQVLNFSNFSPIAVNSPITKCEPDTVQLLASGGTYYSWSPNQFINNTTIANPLVYPNSTTVYSVTIGVVNGTDTCKSILTTTVNVSTLTYNTNSITVSTPIVAGQTATISIPNFNINGTFTIYNLSKPVPETYTVVGNSILFVPKVSGEYSFSYTDQYGCQHFLKTIFIEVQTNECNDGTVYLPTGFTPNSDGVNDVLYIRSNFITEVYLTVYDRWGEKLFETNDIQKGWDGTYKGKQLDQGVYGYYMTFKCNNGQQSFKKGNITLMR